MPGTTCDGQNATCSVSAKKLSTLRSSTILPSGVSGTSSSGTSFVGSRTSKSNSRLLPLREDLHRKFPLGKVAGFNCVPQIATMEVGIGTVDLHRFVPNERERAELRPPVKLHERRIRPWH